jgi:hypothetical protein
MHRKADHAAAPCQGHAFPMTDDEWIVQLHALLATLGDLTEYGRCETTRVEM